MKNPILYIHSLQSDIFKYDSMLTDFHFLLVEPEINHKTFKTSENVNGWYLYKMLKLHLTLSGGKNSNRLDSYHIGKKWSRITLHHLNIKNFSNTRHNTIDWRIFHMLRIFWFWMNTAFFQKKWIKLCWESVGILCVVRITKHFKNDQ